jgi:hypothetical protein
MTSKMSPSGSWKGYSFWTALDRNKDAIKIFLAILAGVNLMTPFDWATLAMTAGVGFIALLAKIGQDAADFYFSGVKLES